MKASEIRDKALSLTGSLEILADFDLRRKDDKAEAIAILEKLECEKQASSQATEDEDNEECEDVAENEDGVKEIENQVDEVPYRGYTIEIFEAQGDGGRMYRADRPLREEIARKSARDAHSFADMARMCKRLNFGTKPRQRARGFAIA